MGISIVLRRGWLLVRDGNSKEAPTIGSKMCGSNSPQAIIGSGNELFIEFNAMGHFKPGFQIVIIEGKISA